MSGVADRSQSRCFLFCLVFLLVINDQPSPSAGSFKDLQKPLAFSLFWMGGGIGLLAAKTSVSKVRSLKCRGFFCEFEDLKDSLVIILGLSHPLTFLWVLAYKAILQLWKFIQAWVWLWAACLYWSLAHRWLKNKSIYLKTSPVVVIWQRQLICETAAIDLWGSSLFLSNPFFFQRKTVSIYG